MSSQEPFLGRYSDPLVSVAITAYNSEKSLARAVDSALQQRADFPIEIVIADDCSKDSTLKIANSYKNLNSSVVRVLERGKNLGIQRNTYETFGQCRGKYIAWLDSDDYWTNPEKLATQVKVLESDSSISVCCHYVRWVLPDGQISRGRYPSLAPGRYGLDEIIRHNFLPTPSVIFRNGIQRELRPWYFDLKSLSDWPIWVLAAQSGDIVLLDSIMSDYVLSPGSSMTSQGKLFWYKMDADFYEQIESILPSNRHRLARAEKGRRYETMAYLLRKDGDFDASCSAAFKAFLSPALMDNLDSKIRALVAALARRMESKFRRGHAGL